MQKHATSSLLALKLALLLLFFACCMKLAAVFAYFIILLVPLIILFMSMLVIETKKSRSFAKVLLSRAQTNRVGVIVILLAVYAIAFLWLQGEAGSEAFGYYSFSAAYQAMYYGSVILSLLALAPSIFAKK